jgi:hypothetical protein
LTDLEGRDAARRFQDADLRLWQSDISTTLRAASLDHQDETEQQTCQQHCGDTEPAPTR